MKIKPVVNSLLLILIFLGSTALSKIKAQNNSKIDSLKVMLSSAKTDSMTINLLIQLSSYYLMNSPDSALPYLNSAKVLADKTGNKRQLSNIYYNFGTSYYNKSDYSNALNNYIKGLRISEETGYKKGISIGFNNIGNVYQILGELDKALEFYEKDLKINEQLNNLKGVAESYGNIGVIFYNKNNAEKALEYYLKGAEISEKIKDSISLTNVYINIGLVYHEQSNYLRAQKFYTKALQISQNSKKKESQTLVLVNMGWCYLDMGEYGKSENCLTKALAFAQEIGSKFYVKYCYQILAELHLKRNDYKSAYQYYTLYSKVKDSIYNEDLVKQTTEMQAKYETEKNQKQIEIQELQIGSQNLELNKKQITIYAVSGSLALMIMLAFVSYRSFKQKQKANILLQNQNSTITLQMDEIEKQKSVIEEKNKNITDSIEYARRLQEAILPDINLVTNSLPGSFIYFRPRDIVSGDFYWYQHKAGKHFIIAADCTGHGVPGAFVSMMCNDIFNQVILEQDINDAGLILKEVNNRVNAIFKKEGMTANAEDGMDVALCVLDDSLRKLEFSGAMNPLLLVRNSEIIQIPADKMPIGGNTPHNYEFKVQSIELRPKDSIYLFSDGYADQFGGEKGKKFMFKKFKQTLGEISSLNPSAQLESLDQKLLNWQGHHERVDDILVIGIKV